MMPLRKLASELLVPKTVFLLFLSELYVRVPNYKNEDHAELEINLSSIDLSTERRRGSRCR